MPALSFAVLSAEGRVLKRASTKGTALRQAERLQAASTDPTNFSVVWCNDTGSPKLWLAIVDADGVHKTASWGR